MIVLIHMILRCLILPYLFSVDVLSKIMRMCVYCGPQFFTHYSWVQPVIHFRAITRSRPDITRVENASAFMDVRNSIYIVLGLFSWQELRVLIPKSQISLSKGQSFAHLNHFHWMLNLELWFVCAQSFSLLSRFPLFTATPRLTLLHDAPPLFDHSSSKSPISF